MGLWYKGITFALHAKNPISISAGPLMNTEFKEESLRLANIYATPGTVKHFAMRLGFMPHNEKDAELILENIVDKLERLEVKYNEEI